MNLLTLPTVHSRTSRVYSTLAVLLLLVSCAASTPATKSPGAALKNRPASQNTAPASGLDSQRAATTLRIKAANKIDSEEFEQAGRLLERALRVDARDPATYYEFARLRYLQGEFKRAEQLAEKGQSLRPDARLRARFKQLELDLEAAENAGSGQS